MTKYVGLVGKNGAGKTTLSNLLVGGLLSSGSTVDVVKFSDILVSTLTLWSLPNNRENLQFLAQVMCNQFGKDALAVAVKTQITSSKSDVVILDSIRTLPDELLLRSLPSSMLVCVDTLSDHRFLRLKDRKEKLNESNLTRSQFEIEEMAINELSIENISNRSDIRVLNNGSSTDFTFQSLKIIEKITTAIF